MNVLKNKYIVLNIDPWHGIRRYMEIKWIILKLQSINYCNIILHTHTCITKFIVILFHIPGWSWLIILGTNSTGNLISVHSNPLENRTCTGILRCRYCTWNTIFLIPTGIYSSVYAVILALCNFCSSTLANSFPHLEFIQTQLCLKRDNLRLGNLPSL